jgi:hypothetical protein
MKRRLRDVSSSVALVLFGLALFSANAQAQLLTPATPGIPAATSYAFNFLASNTTQLEDVPGVSLSGSFDIGSVTTSGSLARVTFDITNGVYSLNNYGTVCAGTFIGSGESDNSTALAGSGPVPTGTMTWTLTNSCLPASPPNTTPSPTLTLYYALAGAGNLVDVNLSVTGIPLNAFGLGYAQPTTITFMDLDVNLVSGIGTAQQVGSSLANVNNPL